jgi:hypothetical protein
MKISLLLFTLILTLSAGATVETASAGARTPIIVPVQWRTSGPGVSYPDASDPTRLLPRIDQLTFACIRFYESKNHKVDGDSSQGWYQFTQSTWESGAEALHILAPTPNDATGNQQSAVAVWYFKHNGRFGVQWAAEENECPGVFNF